MEFTPASIARFAAIITAGLLGIVVLFQLALALGAPWGQAAYGGQKAELPAPFRAASVVAILVWTAVILMLLRRSGIRVWAPVPDSWLPVLIWLVVALLAIGVVGNAITPSAVERAIWLPVTALCLAGTVTVAITARAIDS